MENIITIISSLIGGGVLGTLVGIFTERNKRHAEVKLIEADLLKQMETSYEKLVKNFNDRFEELLKENELLKKEVENLRHELEKRRMVKR